MRISFKYNTLSIGIIIVVFLMVSSCKTAKILTGKHKAMSAKEILFEYYKQDSFPNILSLKFNARLTQNNQSQSANVYVRMKQDSVIWLSVRAMGFEGVRMVLTPDSVKFINRLESSYWVGDYRFVERVFHRNISFHAFQNILLVKMHDYSGGGLNKLSPCNDSLYYCLYQDSQLGEGHNSLYPFAGENVSQQFLFYPETFSLASQIFTSDITQEQLQINYDVLKFFNDIAYPENIEINTTGQFAIHLTLETKSVQSDKKLKTPFKIPDKYQIIRL